MKFRKVNMDKSGKIRGEFVGFWGLGFAMLCVGFFAVNDSAFATCTTDSTTGDVTCTESTTATVHVAEACTMTATVNTPHIADITNGLYSGGIAEYANGIGKTTLKVICNDASGFSIYAVGYTNNEFGNTKLMTNTADSSAPIINTNTYNNGDTSAWSMKINAVSGTYAPTLDNSFGSYHNVPSTYTRVAYRTSGTDVSNGTTEATGSSVEATYAAYISPTQPAGTYSGQVKYTLVHPANTRPAEPIVCPSGKICYNPNGGNVIGTMGQQTVSTYATYATLLASNFSRTGYGFAGWSDVFDYNTNANAKFYGPNETITFTAGQYSGTNNGLSLYAVWIKSAGNLQDGNKVAELCGNTAQSITGSLTTAPTDGTANLSSVSALTDQRDNNTYAIAKLADGKCWMIENLRLENTAEHNSDGSLAQGYGISTTYGNFAGLAEPESANFTISTTANSLYYSGTQSGDATVNIGTSNYPEYRMPRYNNWNNQSTSADRPQNPTTNSATNSTTNAGMYSYGNYYTWHAAMANTTLYSGPTATDADGKTSETVNTSLCPTGWRLPYGRNTGNGTIAGGFYNLNYKINNDSNVTESTASLKLRSFPNNFLYSGYFESHRGSFGYYWSSTANSGSNSWYLYLRSSNVTPGTSLNDKCNGQSIRCTVGA